MVSSSVRRRTFSELFPSVQCHGIPRGYLAGAPDFRFAHVEERRREKREERPTRSFGNRRSIRLTGTDYRSEGWTFITLNVKGRVPCLSRIEAANVVLSDAGKFVDASWRSIPRHHPRVELGAHVVMPDHFHGLIHLVPEPGDFVPAEPEGFGNPRSGSLSTYVRLFKTEVTRHLRREFQVWPGWQRGFYERIVRNEAALRAIERYIVLNPVRARSS